MSNQSIKKSDSKSTKSSGQKARNVKSTDSSRKVSSGKEESKSNRRLHINPPSSASEIREALGITKSDLEDAREAIETST